MSIKTLSIILLGCAVSAPYTLVLASSIGNIVVPAQGVKSNTWTGFYAGLNGGYGWGNPTISDGFLYAGAPIATYFPGFTYTPHNSNNKLSGGTAGGQMGLDWLFKGRYVLGLKFDMDWSGLTHNSVDAWSDNSGDAGNYITSYDLAWFGNLLPRIGFLPKKNVLVYAEGGLAFGHINGAANVDLRPDAIEYPGSISKTLPGWSAGAGMEWMIRKHISLSLEYLYTALENKTILADSLPVAPPIQAQYKFKTSYQTTELGLNYRFS